MWVKDSTGSTNSSAESEFFWLWIALTKVQTSLVIVDTPVLTSTLLLTVLMMVGLFFFIRASVKERIQQVKLVATQSEELLFTQLRTYFDQRAYQVKSVDSDSNRVTFQGFVQPSWFLAIFLTFLAACGCLCLALVLAYLYPTGANFWLLLTLIAPIAGIFYWRKARRIEEVSLSWQSLNSEETVKPEAKLLTVTAHRDEIIALRKFLPLEPFGEG